MLKGILLFVKEHILKGGALRSKRWWIDNWHGDCEILKILNAHFLLSCDILYVLCKVPPSVFGFFVLVVYDSSVGPLFQHFIHCAVSLVISSFSGDVYPLLPPSFSHCLLRSDLPGLRQVPILRFLQIPEYVSNPLSWSPPSFWRRILLSIFVPLPFYTAHWQLSPNIYLFVAILFNLPIMQLGCTGWVNISKPIS